MKKKLKMRFRIWRLYIKYEHLSCFRVYDLGVGGWNIFWILYLFSFGIFFYLEKLPYISPLWILLHFTYFIFFLALDYIFLMYVNIWTHIYIHTRVNILFPNLERVRYVKTLRELFISPFPCTGTLFCTRRLTHRTHQMIWTVRINSTVYGGTKMMVSAFYAEQGYDTGCSSCV